MVIITLGAAQLCCGGGVTPEARRCQDSYRQMMDKKEDSICSPILYNAFESRVTEWRKECGNSADAQKQKQITQKLTTARECSEEKRQVEMLATSCSNRLKKVANAEICLGKECVPYLEELKEIAADCNGKRLNGKYTEEIEAATRVFEERINEKNRLLGIRNLIMTCDGIYDVNGQKQARAALSDIIDAVSLTEYVYDKHKPGTEVERFRKGALDSCGFALSGVMEKLCELSPQEIERITSSGRRQKRYIKKYRRYGDRLQAIYAAALFPNAMTPLTEVLKKIGASEEEATFEVIPPPVTARATEETPEKAETKTPKTEVEKAKAEAAAAKTEPETAKSGAAGDQVKSPETKETATTGEGVEGEPKQLSKADEKKCKQWRKKLKHFTAKANAYEKKGNEPKTTAYRAKQDKTRQKMEETGCPMP